MEFRRLEYFEAVARTGSFTKAAEELCVAQPTITTAIKRMEEELGVALLVRDKRSVMLTCEGKIFLEKVVDILERIEGSVKEMQEMSAANDWMLNIGVTPINGAFVTPALYRDFMEKYPMARLQVMELGSYGIMEALKSDEIELGYMVLRDEAEILKDYETFIIRRGEMKVLVHNDNPLSKKKTISIGDLAGIPLIYLPTHSYIRQKIDAEFQKHGLVPNILSTPQQMVTTYNLVANNVGVSFVLGDEFTSLIRSEQMTAVCLDNPVTYKAGFVWKKGRVLSKAAKKCIQFIHGYFEAADQ